MLACWKTVVLSLTTSILAFSWNDTAGKCKGGDQHTGSIPHTQGDLVPGGSPVPTWPQAATSL